MKALKLRVLAQVLPFLLVAPGVALAQHAPTRGEATAATKAAPPKAATQPAATQYSRQQIDQMIAPIALYPDELLAQVLMAATYTEQLVEAAKWLDEANRAELKDAALMAALEPLPWDPSVKALVAFPQVIAMMTDHIEWTGALGVAFATQQAEVMNRVQALRQLAVKSGKIDKVKQVSVRREGPSIVIVSAEPDRIFVPVYNPTIVYGAWPDREYPPVYLPPPRRFAESRGFVVQTVEPGFEVIGVPVVRQLWGWTKPNWGSQRITINTVEYTRITRTVRAPQGGTWRREGPVVLVARAAVPRPTAPATVAMPAGTVAPMAAAAVVALPQRAQAQPNAIRVQAPAAAPTTTAQPTPSQSVPAPTTTAQPSTTPAPAATTTAQPSPTPAVPTTTAQPSATPPAQAPTAAKPSAAEPAAKQATSPATPKPATAEADKAQKPAARIGADKPSDTPAAAKPGEPARSQAEKAKPAGTPAHERQTGQKEPGQKEPGQKEPGQKESGQKDIGQKEPATPPAAKAEAPKAAPAAERTREHGQAGAGGKAAEPAAKAAPEQAAGRPAAAPQPAPERVGAGAPAPRAPEQATARPPAPAQTGAAVPPGHGGQRPAATSEPVQGSSAPPGKQGPAAAPGQRPRDASKGEAPGQSEAGEKKER